MIVRELQLTYGPGALTASESGILCPLDAALLIRPFLKDKPHESFMVIPMTTKRRPLGFIELARGAVNYVSVEPAEVIRAVLMANAPAFFVAHNHPSGDPTPSPHDRDLTEKLRAVSATFTLDFTDHIIIGGDVRYVSFKEIGLL